MSFQTNSIDKNGLARTPDGKLYVTIAGASGATTPAGASGFATLLAQSYVPVSAPADTTEDTLATITLPANALGLNGGVRITTAWSMTNNTNAKTGKVKFGAASVTVLNGAVSIASGQSVSEFYNRGATNSQLTKTWTLISSSQVHSPVLGTGSVDTTASVSITITGQKATGTDTLTLEGYTVELLKP